MTDFTIRKIELKRGTDKIPPSPHHNILPNHPARVMFSGNSKSGKTVAMLNLITRKDLMRGYFDMIFVFSPTAAVDDTWDGIIGHNNIIKPTNVHPIPTEELIIDILTKQDGAIAEMGKRDSPRLLIIFDDCLGMKIIRSPIFAELFYKGRHYNTSVWLTTQYYFKIPKDVRQNCSNIVLFKPRRSELKVICEELCPADINLKQTEDIINYATKERYNFLHYNGDAEPDKVFRRNFDNLINIRSFIR